MSKIWFDSFIEKIVQMFFIGIHKSKDLQKGISTFYDVFIFPPKNYQYYYNTSPGFKFFIDSTPLRIIEIFEKDQLKYKKPRKNPVFTLRKIKRAVLSFGISLFTDAVVDMTFGLFKTNDLEKIALDETFNTSMYALGYSKYWKD